MVLNYLQLIFGLHLIPVLKWDDLHMVTQE